MRTLFGAILGLVFGAPAGAVVGFMIGMAVAIAFNINCFDGTCGNVAVAFGLAGLVSGGIGGATGGILIARRKRNA